jgi:hypothetical protein
MARIADASSGCRLVRIVIRGGVIHGTTETVVQFINISE